MNVVFAIVLVLGLVVTVGIYWFGLRSARRHDEEHPPGS